MVYWEQRCILWCWEQGSIWFRDKIRAFWDTLESHKTTRKHKNRKTQSSFGSNLGQFLFLIQTPLKKISSLLCECTSRHPVTNIMAGFRAFMTPDLEKKETTMRSKAIYQKPEGRSIICMLFHCPAPYSPTFRKKTWAFQRLGGLIKRPVIFLPLPSLSRADKCHPVKIPLRCRSLKVMQLCWRWAPGLQGWQICTQLRGKTKQGYLYRRPL